MLNNPTLVVAQIVLTLFYAVIFIGVHRIYPHLRGIRYLICGFLAASLARAYFVMMQPSSPHLGAAVFLGNSFALLATTLFYVAVLRHAGSSRSPRLAWVIMTVGSLAIAPWSRAYLGAFATTIICSIAFATLRGIFARELFLQAADRPLARVFSIFMAFYAFLGLNQIILQSAFLQSAYPNLFPSTLPTIILMLNVCCSTSMGFFLLFLVGNSIMRLLEVESRTDSLTHTLNRRGIDNKLAEEFSQSAREGRLFCLAVIDVDYFKSINDRFGHSVGDAVLARIANVIASQIRLYDSVGRFGGDEFLLILPSTDGADGLAIVERICESVSAMSFMPDLSLSVSIGLAQYESTDSLAELLSRADAALYMAKKSGRGCARLLLQDASIAPTRIDIGKIEGEPEALL